MSRPRLPRRAPRWLPFCARRPSARSSTRPGPQPPARRCPDGTPQHWSSPASHWSVCLRTTISLATTCRERGPFLSALLFGYDGQQQVGCRVLAMEDAIAGRLRRGFIVVVAAGIQVAVEARKIRTADFQTNAMSHIKEITARVE